MHGNRLAIAGLAFTTVLTGLAGGAARAADMTPVYKARPAVVTDNYYVWVDGMYERVNLPTYSLGMKNIGSFPFPDSGAVQSFDPHLNGAGVRGAIGYLVPGSSLRLEAGASFVAADANQSQSGAVAPNVALQFLSGAFRNDGLNCNAFACSVSGTLKTEYTAWQLNGKALYDWRFGAVAVTPSVAVFGGGARAKQTLSQSLTQILPATGAVLNTANYAANTSLRWTDVGARVGLDFAAAVSNALTLGIGGWVGVAERYTSLSGTDLGIATTALFTGNSAVSASATTGVLVANAEAGFAYKFSPTSTFRGFVGVNYDDKVPGITRPIYTGPVNAPTSLVPAGIFYAHETSYYAGAGVLVTFGGPVVAKY